MSLSGFEALVVALIFLAPGALFLYEGARYYSPAMRSEYLRRQFPLELTIHYLLASVAIHSILVFLLTCLLFAVARVTHDPDLVRSWYKTLLQFPQVSTPQFATISVSGLGYLVLSLLLAYLGAKKLRRQLLLPEPLWCEELIRILGHGGSIEVSATKKDSSAIEGQLISLRYVGGERRDFEMLLSVSQESYTTVWLGSEIIQELTMLSSSGTWKFVFASESLSKEKQEESTPDS